ncbi:MAG: ketoacyl-ACP synthase III [Pseudomonadota bacterium]
MRTATIKGVGHFTPNRKIPNSYFDDYYKKSIGPFLEEKRNIKQRFFMEDDQVTSDLIVEASKKALNSAQLKVEDVDLIIVATDTPDYISPSTAAVVQHKMGAKNAGCFDINSACAGFVTAIDMAWKYVKTDQQYDNILVVGAYGMSRYFDWDDYKITSMFGDGAGAVVISSTEEKGFLASELTADGQYHDYMGIYGGGTSQPFNPEMVQNKAHLLSFAKKIPPEHNVTAWPGMIHSILDRIQKKPNDVSKFFLTQLNIDTINASMEAIGVDRDRSHNVMDQFGYTGSACIPMALSDAVEKKAIQKGDLVFFLGSGGGLSQAGIAMTWGMN